MATETRTPESANLLWERFQNGYFYDPGLSLSLDFSRVAKFEQALEKVDFSKAFAEMGTLERGAIANKDENRMVGHYWLRAPELAPTPEIRRAIEECVSSIQKFSTEVHSGKILGSSGKKFSSLLVVGIGGSALGPQFVTDALGGATEKLHSYFFDNTDPDGMGKVLDSIPDLKETLVIIISKSGGTKETRNGQLVIKKALADAGCVVSKHMVAVTGEGSELDQTARKENWLVRFPMWDWVGGRTSELSSVGLLPAALAGFDISEMLMGGKLADTLTRRSDLKQNPAAMLALAWYQIGEGRGAKDMVVLPYKDRLSLFSKYLQQLVMESLGKELDRDGKRVLQGIAVYGNKGSTDQHAYVQQLRDGVHNFFATFIEVLNDSAAQTKSKVATTLEVEAGTTNGDYLHGFLLGTREALYQNGRESITITIPEVNARNIGALIALFERAVGFYATLVNINAYHQPGVEAGKKAAAKVLALQMKVMQELKAVEGAATADELAARIGEKDAAETIFLILRRLSARGDVIAKNLLDPAGCLFGIKK